MQKVLIINGMDITPFIAKDGYKFQTEELENETTHRSIADGSLIRDRVGRFATLEINIKAYLTHKEAQRILQLQQHVHLTCQYLNYETMQLETGEFYIKIKSPNIAYIQGNDVRMSAFTFTLKAYRRYGK